MHSCFLVVGGAIFCIAPILADIGEMPSLDTQQPKHSSEPLPKNEKGTLPRPEV